MQVSADTTKSKDHYLHPCSACNQCNRKNTTCNTHLAHKARKSAHLCPPRNHILQIVFVASHPQSETCRACTTLLGQVSSRAPYHFATTQMRACDFAFTGCCGRWAVGCRFGCRCRRPGRRPVQLGGVRVSPGAALALHLLLTACRCAKRVAQCRRGPQFTTQVHCKCAS